MKPETCSAETKTRPRGLMLTCERIHLFFLILKSKVVFSSHCELEGHSFETCMTSEWSLIFKKYFRNGVLYLRNILEKFNE